jgi:acetyl-CoA carboxylase carboxyltransferase component
MLPDRFYSSTRRGGARMRRKKKTLERKHRVKARLQVEELAKAGSALYLDIFADEEKIGTIEIGRGSFIWWGGKRKKRRKISWSDFAELLDRYFYDQR